MLEKQCIIAWLFFITEAVCVKYPDVLRFFVYENELEYMCMVAFTTMLVVAVSVAVLVAVVTVMPNTL